MSDVIPECRICARASAFGDPCPRCQMELLQDFMIEEILAMSDEEILKDMTDEDWRSVDVLKAKIAELCVAHRGQQGRSVTTHRYRSAITGRYVSEAYAKANPETTVRERVKDAPAE